MYEEPSEAQKAIPGTIVKTLARSTEAIYSVKQILEKCKFKVVFYPKSGFGSTAN